MWKMVETKLQAPECNIQPAKNPEMLERATQGMWIHCLPRNRRLSRYLTLLVYLSEYGTRRHGRVPRCSIVPQSLSLNILTKVRDGEGREASAFSFPLKGDDDNLPHNMGPTSPCWACVCASYFPMVEILPVQIDARFLLVAQFTTQLSPRACAAVGAQTNYCACQ